MSKTVVINLGKGTLSKGFPYVTARLWTASQPQAEQFVGSLEPAPTLMDIYRIWQSTYRALSNRLVLRSTAAVEAIEDELEIESGGITQVSQQSFEDYSQQLKQAMNRWLNSAGMLTIERQLRSHLTPTEEIRVIFETDDDLLLRLPWHCWDFFKDYPKAEMALSRPEYQRQAVKGTQREKIRILAIVGDRRGIDVELEQQMLRSLSDAEVKFLVAPSRKEFDRHLWDSTGWDLLFFAGHSQTEQQTGRLYINENASRNSLTIEQLEEGLKAAIANGLHLAIFNSCDGVGLAQALGRLQIPQVIVMRESVPNRVAQTFLQYFLAAFATDRLPLYPAMRQARGQLQGLEDEFPGASWLPVLCQNPTVEPLSWADLGGISACPYRGLAAFQEADADLFFGREKVTADLLAAVRQQPFVAVVGPSGSGKSSVVLAGLIPQLKRSSKMQDWGWQIAVCRPGPMPCDSLAEALMTSWAKEIEDEEFRIKVMALAVNFQQNPQALCEEIAQQQRVSGKRSLLIIDQFEELYTLSSEADRQSFLDLLMTATNTAPTFTLLITLRADFYGHALSDRRLSDALQAGGYNLSPLGKDELERAIALPAAKSKVMLEPGLTDKLIQDTASKAGRLPLLEFALSELWTKQQNGCLTHRAYQSIGGVEAALANHAETVYAQLSADDQPRVQRIFMQLISPGVHQEATRRIASRDEVGEDNWDLVSKLASARLVVTNRNSVTERETVEIIHEALIRSWGRLVYWLQADGEFRQWQEELRQASERWEKSEKEEAALLRGKQLTTAEEWYCDRFEDLSAADRTFVQQSLQAQKQAVKQQKRRQRAIVSGLSLGLVSALSLSGLTWMAWQRAALSEVRAIATSSNAQFVSGQKLDALVDALRAQHKLDDLMQANKGAFFEVERALQQALSRADEKNRLSGHEDAVTAVVFNQNGLVSAGKDGKLNRWQADGTLLNSIDAHEQEIWGLAVSADGRTIATASNDRTIKLWRPDGSLIKTLTGHNAAVNAVAFGSDARLISADEAGMVKLWRPDGTVIKTFPAHQEKIDAIALSPDGQTIATASGDNTVKLWDLDGSFQKTLKGHNNTVRGVAFSPDGQTIATASADQTVKLWNLDGSLRKTLEGHTSTVFGVTFSPDGQTLASASHDGTIRLWRLDGSLMSTLAGHRDGVLGVTFSPDGRTLASASYDRTIRLWQNNNPLLANLQGHTEAIFDIAFSPDGTTFATASSDKTIGLWSADGTLLKRLEGHKDEVFGLAFSLDEQTIVSGSKDGAINLWNREGKLKRALNAAHESWVHSLAFSPDGQVFVSAGEDNMIKLWNKDGGLVKELKNAHEGGVNRVAFSPDGQLFASASEDNRVKLWNRKGDLVEVFEGHRLAVNGVAFSPDGQLLASASSDGSVKLWQLDGRLITSLEAHSDVVLNVAFSPDGQQIASTSEDKTINIWSREGALLHTLNGYLENVLGVAFSPEGRQLAATGADASVTLWNLETALHEQRISALGCEWIGDYLNNGFELASGDEEICS